MKIGSSDTVEGPDPACGADGMLAGGHWGGANGPGEGIGEVTCNAGGTGTHMFSPPDGTWTIGGAAATDIMLRSFMVHEGSSGPRQSCGVPVKKL